MIVPLGTNAYKRTLGFSPEVQLVNMYVEQDKSGASPDNVMRIDRPGLTSWLASPFIPRGLFHQDGLYQETWGVFGTSLYAIAAGSALSLGSVGAGDRIRWAANYEHLFILSGTTAYLYDGATVAAIAMPDGREVVDIDVLNNYLILGCPDGRFYWIVPGATIVDPLDFATAESSPDGLVAVRTIGDEVFLLGQTNSEVWQTTGDSSAPFSRAAGRNFTRGCMSRDTALLFDNSLFWVGNDGNLYRYANIATIISDNGLAQRIRQRTGDLSACLVEADGHKHYVLKVPGQGSFGFDPSTSQLSEFATYEATEWAPGCSMQIADRWYVGSDTSAKVWFYDPEAVTDDGLTIKRIVTGTVPLMGLPGRHDNFSIGAGGTDDFTILLRWKDGQGDYPDMYDEIEIRAPADIGSIYRLGTPEQPYRTFEVTIRDAVKARISGALCNESWQ